MASTLQDRTCAVEATHGVKARYQGFAFVHEMVDGRTLWKGYVDIYAISDHPTAAHAFAWSWQENGALRHATALAVAPTLSPHEAVHAALASRLAPHG